MLICPPRWIKGIWDTRQNGESILVTGSSRLDVFRRGGDSLLGRYHYYRLHPFSVAELDGREDRSEAFPRQPPELRFAKPSSNFDPLLCWGGFPEPLFSKSDRTLRRWQKERFERVFREDIRDTENVRSLSQVELLGQLLPTRVASPLSFQSLAEDLEASPKTVKSWMELLCRIGFRFAVRVGLTIWIGRTGSGRFPRTVFSQPLFKASRGKSLLGMTSPRVIRQQRER